MRATSVLLVGFISVIFVLVLKSVDGFNTPNEPIEAILCVSGLTDSKLMNELSNPQWIIDLNQEYQNKEFSNGMYYHYSIMFMDSIEKCEEMRKDQSIKNVIDTNQEWSPVFIFDFSDKTLFDTLIIEEIVFDNYQTHFRRIMNDMDENKHVKYEPDELSKTNVGNTFPHIDFNFNLEEWQTCKTGRQISDEIRNILKTQQWTVLRATELVELLQSEDESNMKEEQKVLLDLLSDPLLSSKTFYAFNHEKKSGVLFVGEFHDSIQMKEKQLAMVDQMRPWLDTIFTEFPPSHVLNPEFNNDKILFQEFEKVEKSKPVNSRLRLVPLIDSCYSHFTSKTKNIPNLYQHLRYLRRKALPHLPDLEVTTSETDFFNEMLNLNRPENMKRLLWRYQYAIGLEDETNQLMRSMLHFMTVHEQIRPSTWNMVILGGFHAVDIFDLINDSYDNMFDLLSDPNNVPDLESLVGLKPSEPQTKMEESSVSAEKEAIISILEAHPKLP